MPKIITDPSELLKFSVAKMIEDDECVNLRSMEAAILQDFIDRIILGEDIYSFFYLADVIFGMRHCDSPMKVSVNVLHWAARLSQAMLEQGLSQVHPLTAVENLVFGHNVGHEFLKVKRINGKRHFVETEQCRRDDDVHIKVKLKRSLRANLDMWELP